MSTKPAPALPDSGKVNFAHLKLITDENVDVAKLPESVKMDIDGKEETVFIHKDIKTFKIQKGAYDTSKSYNRLETIKKLSLRIANAIQTVLEQEEAAETEKEKTDREAKEAKEAQEKLDKEAKDKADAEAQAKLDAEAAEKGKEEAKANELKAILAKGDGIYYRDLERIAGKSLGDDAEVCGIKLEKAFAYYYEAK